MKNNDVYFDGKYKIVSFETATMARLKNFDLHTLHVYNRAEEIAEDEIWDYVYTDRGGMTLHQWFHKFNQRPQENGKWCISAPTQDQLKTWLREKHHIIVEIHVANTNDPMDYLCTVKRMDKNGNWSTKYKTKEELGYKGTKEKLSYEDTLEEGLFKALALI